MLVRRRLEALRPVYVGLNGRARLGVSMLCPRSDIVKEHAAEGEHFITLWFRNPDDGVEGPDDVAPLCLRQGVLEDLPHFTVWRQDGNPVLVPGHWSGYIIEGDVWDAISFGPF